MQIQNISSDAFIPELPEKKNALDADAFLRLLVVQLSTQNPLEPMNDRDFFAQMAQLGMVDGIGRMRKGMELAQGASFIGKVVEVLPNDSGGEIVRGVVEAVEMRNGNVNVIVGGMPYGLEQVIRITM
ncbi:MAG TPA: flagellar hook capping FlgD N-terminal domain-containing protein [Fimbriimonadales bacterium]|nr:flagellar hook capping FlgD N-terminal domain-containing protein [Fimbriimonadales bacterium]